MEDLREEPGEEFADGHLDTMRRLSMYDGDRSRRTSTISIPVFILTNDEYHIDNNCADENYDEDTESNISEPNKTLTISEEDIPGNMNKAITSAGSEPEPIDIDVIKEIDADVLKELEEAFELFDWNRDGLITHADLKKTFLSLGQNLPDEEITSMLAEGSKPLDFEGFVNLIGGRVMEIDSEDILTDALSKWDYEQTGLISKKRIREDLMSKGDRFTEAEVEWALEEAPTTVRKGATMIQYHNFCQILCGMRKKEDILG